MQHSNLYERIVLSQTLTIDKMLIALFVVELPEDWMTAIKFIIGTHGNNGFQLDLVKSFVRIKISNLDMSGLFCAFLGSVIFAVGLVGKF